MDYNKIKSDHDSIQREIIKTKSKLRSLKEKVEGVADERSKLVSSYSESYASKKKSALESHKKEAILSKEEELVNAEKELEQLKIEKDSELSTLTEEHFLQQCTSEQEILAEIREASAVLKEKLKLALGTKFYSELEHQLNTTIIDLQESDIERVIRYFNQNGNWLSKTLEQPNVLETMISRFESFDLKRNQDTEKKQTNVLLFSIFALLGMFLAFQFVAPFYVVFLVFWMAYNIVKYYKVYRTIIIQKAVQDNISQIDVLLHNKINAELAKRRDEATMFYNEKILTYENQIEQLHQDISETLLQAETLFVFDDEVLKSMQEANLNRKDKEEAVILSEIHELERTQKNLWKELDLCKNKLTKEAKEIQTKFLNFDKVGTAVTFDPVFIFDVIDNKPIYFTHPQTSCLFLYDSNSDVSDFVRLLAIQLRIKLNPFNLAITVCDPTFLGTSYIQFQDTNARNSTTKKLFDIYSNVESFHQRLLEYDDDVLRRTMAIKRDFSAIKEYNEFMLDIDSLTESYEFLFVQDPVNSLFNASIMGKLLLNGADLGIFSHIFLNRNVFYEMGNSVKDLISNVGRIYKLEDGTLVERAKEFVMEQMIKQN